MRRGITLVGFVVALVAAALVTPAGAQSGDGRDDVGAGLELLAYVPSGDDQTCLLSTPDDIAADPLTAPLAARVRGFLRCSADDGAVSLFVLGLDDIDAVNRLYDAYTPNGFSGGAPGCDTEGTWGDGQGRLKCYSTGSGSGVVWTLEADNLVFAAFRADDDVDALHEWWRHDAPPIDDPPAASKPLTDSQWRANGQVLAKSVPKTLRGSCRAPAMGADALGPLYRNLLHLRAVLTCDPGDGVTALRFISLESRRAMQAYADAYAPAADEEAPRVRSEGVFCEGTGTWSRRGGQGGGDRLCWFEASGLVAMLWTDNSQAVVVQAARSDGDAEALIGFYQGDAGPLANRALAKRVG